MPDRTTPDRAREDVDADDTADEPAPAGGRAVPLRTLGLAVGVLALLALAVLAVVQRGRIGDLEDDLAARDDVRMRAAEFAEAYLTFDSSDVESSLDAVRPLMTADFAREYESNRSPAVEELFANLDTTTTVEIVDVYLADVEDDRAQALVVIDLEATSEATGTQRLRDLSFVVDLVPDDDGGWLVSAVAPGPQPSADGTEPGGGEPGTATTTTTAPTTTAPTTTAPAG